MPKMRGFMTVAETKNARKALCIAKYLRSRKVDPYVTPIRSDWVVAVYPEDWDRARKLLSKAKQTCS